MTSFSTFQKYVVLIFLFIWIYSFYWNPILRLFGHYVIVCFLFTSSHSSYWPLWWWQKFEKPVRLYFRTNCCHTTFWVMYLSYNLDQYTFLNCFLLVVYWGVNLVGKDIGNVRILKYFCEDFQLHVNGPRCLFFSFFP